MSNNQQKVKPLTDMLKAIADINNSFLEVVNNNGDTAKLAKAIKRFNKVRQAINDAENIGIMLNIEKFKVIAFNLTGDPKRDLGQKKTKLPEN